LIVVDTSVWVASFRSATSEEAIHLSTLLESDQVGLGMEDLTLGGIKRAVEYLNRK
jgi:hypothetical protein